VCALMKTKHTHTHTDARGKSEKKAKAIAIWLSSAFFFFWLIYIPWQRGYNFMLYFIDGNTHLVDVLVGFYQFDTQLAQRSQGGVPKVGGNTGLHGAHLRRRRGTRVL